MLKLAVFNSTKYSFNKKTLVSDMATVEELVRTLWYCQLSLLLSKRIIPPCWSDATRAGWALALHHLHPHLLLPPRLLLLDVLWGILPISPGHLSLTSKDPFFQVQFPLSLVSIKYKHFLLFGLAAPVANTSLWLAIRLSKEGQDHQDHQVDLVKNANCYLLKFRIVSLRKRRRFWIFWLWSCQCWSSCSGTPSSSSGSSR